jgi:hypothetical protein
LQLSGNKDGQIDNESVKTTRPGRLSMAGFQVTTHGRFSGDHRGGYRLITNREALNWAYQCCASVFPETKPSEWQVERTDAPSTAGYCHIDLCHNSTALDFAFVRAEQRPETFGPFIRVTNSYNGLRALSFDIGFYRKICRNGMIVPQSVIRFSFNHLQRDVGENIRFEIAHDKLTQVRTSISRYFEILQNCKISRVHFDFLIMNALSLRRPEPWHPKSRSGTEWQVLTSELSKMNDRYAKTWERMLMPYSIR